MTHWKAPLAALLLLPPAALADELEDLYDLDRRLIEADAQALIEIAPYLDSDTPVMDSCLLYTSPSPRDGTKSRMPSSA